MTTSPLQGRVLAQTFLPWHLHRPKKEGRGNHLVHPGLNLQRLDRVLLTPPAAQRRVRVESSPLDSPGRAAGLWGSNSLLQTSLKAECQMFQGPEIGPEFMCKPWELWHQAEPEVRLCWLEKAPGERCQEFSALFSSWGGTVISAWMQLSSHELEWPNMGKGERAGKIKGSMADPVSCFFLWLLLLALALSDAPVCVE